MNKQSCFLRIAGVVLVMLLCQLSSTAKNLSDQAKISLLTCSPGEELYSLFGHSALRVNDPKNNLDLVFNYGTFNFNTPNFYVKFARGKLKYMLSYSSFEQFKKEYVYEKRGIVEQDINLNQESKQKLFDALIENYQPENRYYHYDFLFDNCSTRIRDIIEKNANGKVLFSTKIKSKKTFWDLLDPYMEKSRWIFLGIHIALGMPCDTEASPYEYMFLPDNMMFAFSDAQIEKNDSLTNLVSSEKNILTAQTNFQTTIWYKRPVVVFGLLALFGLVISILYYRRKRNWLLFDLLIFNLTGLVGWIVVFLWFFTDHQATGPNLNILWAFPLHFPCSFLLLKKKLALTYYYFFFYALLLLFVLALWPVLPQSLPNQILPFLVLLLIRSIYIVKKLRSFNN